jgi:hypothetical protein
MDPTERERWLDLTVDEFVKECCTRRDSCKLYDTLCKKICDLLASTDDGAKVVAILYRTWGLRNQREPSLRALAIRGMQGPQGEVLTAILKAYASFTTVVKEHRPLLTQLSSVPYHLATVEALKHYDLTVLTDAGRQRLFEFIFDEVLKQRLSAEEDDMQATWIQEAETVLNGDHGAVALDAFSSRSNAQQQDLPQLEELSLPVASAYVKKLLAGQSNKLNVNLFVQLAADSSTYLRFKVPSSFKESIKEAANFLPLDKKLEAAKEDTMVQEATAGFAAGTPVTVMTYTSIPHANAIPNTSQNRCDAYSLRADFSTSASRLIQSRKRNLTFDRLPPRVSSCEHPLRGAR